MALDFLNRCIFTATSAGTGAFQVASPVAGFLAPSSAGAVSGRSYRYFAQSDDLSQWEVGTGAWDGTELTRDVLQSSNSNAVVTFSAAPKVAMGGPLAGDMPGWQVISQGEVTTTVEYIDIALPDGYREFQLNIAGLLLDTQDYLAFAFSDDGGATFHADDVNYDSYEICDPPIFIGGSVDAWGDALGYLQQGSPNSGAKFDSSIKLFPGGAGEYAYVAGNTCFEHSSGFLVNELTLVRLVEATGRQNVLRIMPYGNGDANPPTSGVEIVSGVYQLTGWPA